MTEEQIEQKAEEYVKSVIDVNAFDWKIVREICLAYVAGATENSIQWHDLRKNPDDVPENNDIVLNQKGEYVRYFPEYKTWTWQNCDNYGLEMIAWCEKPTFDET